MSSFSKSYSIIISLSFHAALFLLLYVFEQETPSKFQPIEIELLGQQTAFEQIIKDTPAQDREEVALRSSSEFKTKKKLSNNIKENMQSLQKKVVTSLTGESDLEIDLRGEAPKNDRQKYLAQIRGRVAMGQVYPKSSRRFKEEGTVKLLLTVERNGSLSKVEIISRSKFKRLDDAALKAVTKVAPFNNFPKTVAFHQWKIKLPIRFSLSN